MKQLLYFSLGAVCGAALTYFCTKRYYEGIIDDEIASVKEAYNKKEEDDISESEESDEAREHFRKSREALNKYKSRVRSLGYAREETVDEDDIEREEELVEEPDVTVYPREGRADKPYVISPEIYHEELCGVYDKEALVYWAGNDCLVSEDQEHLDIESTVGAENLKTVGQYEDDTVYIRNERLGMDFEVCFVDGSFGEE